MDLATCTPEHEVSSLIFMLICLVITNQGRGSKCNRAETVLDRFLCVVRPAREQVAAIRLDCSDDDVRQCTHQSVSGIFVHVSASTEHLQAL